MHHIKGPSYISPSPRDHATNTFCPQPACSHSACHQPAVPAPTQTPAALHHPTAHCRPVAQCAVLGPITTSTRLHPAIHIDGTLCVHSCATSQKQTPYSPHVHRRGANKGQTNSTAHPSIHKNTHEKHEKHTKKLQERTELMAKPPHAACSRSMLRFLARRSPMIPSLASRSSEMGSMPFWLITTKPLAGSSPHTCGECGFHECFPCSVP